MYYYQNNTIYNILKFKNDFNKKKYYVYIFILNIIINIKINLKLLKKKFFFLYTYRRFWI